MLFIAKNGRAKCDLESLSLSLFFCNIFTSFHPATDSSAMTVCASITRFPLSRPREKSCALSGNREISLLRETDGQCVITFVSVAVVLLQFVSFYRSVSSVCACRACVWLCLDPTDGHDQKRKKEPKRCVNLRARVCVCVRAREVREYSPIPVTRSNQQFGPSCSGAEIRARLDSFYTNQSAICFCEHRVIVLGIR